MRRWSWAIMSATSAPGWLAPGASEAAAASSAYRDARRAFDGDPAGEAALRDAAQGLSVPGA